MGVQTDVFSILIVFGILPGLLVVGKCSHLVPIIKHLMSNVYGRVYFE